MNADQERAAVSINQGKSAVFAAASLLIAGIAEIARNRRNRKSKKLGLSDPIHERL
jgi:hypothetical protein